MDINFFNKAKTEKFKELWELTEHSPKLYRQCKSRLLKETTIDGFTFPNLKELVYKIKSKEGWAKK